MEILRYIRDYAAKPGLCFLLIGGHAINTYGVQRGTADVDLLVERSKREQWKDILQRIRYSVYFEHENFIQFKPPELGLWPVDLMLVDDGVFSKLDESAEVVELGGIQVRVPSIKHLIALKLHAMKERFQKGSLKDFDDIVNLLKVGGLDIASNELRELSLKYVSEEQYQQLKAAAQERND